MPAIKNSPNNRMEPTKFCQCAIAEKFVWIYRTSNILSSLWQNLIIHDFSMTCLYHYCPVACLSGFLISDNFVGDVQQSVIIFFAEIRFCVVLTQTVIWQWNLFEDILFWSVEEAIAKSNDSVSSRTKIGNRSTLQRLQLCVALLALSLRSPNLLFTDVSEKYRVRSLKNILQSVLHC